jgi:protein involved in polysaccharide export with SLBB domain
VHSHIRMICAVVSILIPLTSCHSPGSDLPMLSKTPESGTYRLGPGDQVALKVLGANELDGNYTIQDDGTIRVLMIGTVPAAGTTSDALENGIADKLKTGGFIKEPRVSVEVIKYRPFYILGEVTRPGSYPYASGMRVLSAVADAQGYTYRANEQYVIITRNGRSSRADVLMPVRPDDIIRVPERYF